MSVWRATWIVLGLCLCRQGWADIYVYTASDGTVSLSNVPADDRYTVLIGSSPQGGTAPVDDTRKPVSGLARKARFDKVVEQVSRTYGLESALVHAVISVESRYDPKAVSKKGAVGLMQLMPETAKRYGVTDAFDPVQNVAGGARYLRDLLTLFHSDVSLAVAAFNAGENAVMKYGNRIPPYRETVRYVPQVLDFYQRYRADGAL